MRTTLLLAIAAVLALQQPAPPQPKPRPKRLPKETREAVRRLSPSEQRIFDQSRPKPKPPEPYTVDVFLLPGATPDEQQLAQEVREIMDRSRPENPGREKTFGRCTLHGFNFLNWRKTLVKRVGWSMLICDVKRLDDGWRARCLIFIAVVNAEGKIPSITDRHEEVYRCKNGEITLESEKADQWEPGQGFWYWRMSA
jgi:hypothetical protein